MGIYKKINEAIIQRRPIAEDPNLTDHFDVYLNNNKVAYYYYSSVVKKNHNVIDVYERYSKQYKRSLILLHEVCRANKIDFLLYKTNKFIPDINDGDIDIIVKREDFHRFLGVFNDLGFNTEEDEPGKGKAVKDGYCVIEPHITMSWRGGGYLDESTIWKNTISIEQFGKNYKNVSYDVEALAILAKVLFEPSYLDMNNSLSLRYFKSRGVDIKSVMSLSSRSKILSKVWRYYNTADIYSDKMPAFLPNILYLKLWTQNLFISKDIKVYLQHIVYFIYWKYRYKYKNTLPFTHHHEWR